MAQFALNSVASAAQISVFISQPILVLMALQIILFRYVLPMSLITLNDIMAFYVGFFFGKTPLIKVGRTDVSRFPNF